MVEKRTNRSTQPSLLERIRGHREGISAALGVSAIVALGGCAGDTSDRTPEIATTPVVETTPEVLETAPAPVETSAPAVTEQSSSLEDSTGIEVPDFGEFSAEAQAGLSYEELAELYRIPNMASEYSQDSQAAGTEYMGLFVDRMNGLLQLNATPEVYNQHPDGQGYSDFVDATVPLTAGTEDDVSSFNPAFMSFGPGLMNYNNEDTNRFLVVNREIKGKQASNIVAREAFGEDNVPKYAARFELDEASVSSNDSNYLEATVTLKSTPEYSYTDATFYSGDWTGVEAPAERTFNVILRTIRFDDAKDSTQPHELFFAETTGTQELR